MRKEENCNVANLKVYDSVIKIFNEWLPTDCDMAFNLERMLVIYFNIKNSRQIKKVRNERKFHLITDEKKYMIELFEDDEVYLSIIESENIVVYYRIRVGDLGYYYADFMKIEKTIENYLFEIDREACGKVSKDGELIIEMQYNMTHQGNARYNLDEINEFIEYYSEIAHNPKLYMQIYKKMSSLFHYLGEYLILDIYSDNKRVKTIEFISENVKITLYMNNEEYYLKHNLQEDNKDSIGYSNPGMGIFIYCVKDSDEYKIKFTRYNSYLYCNKEFIESKKKIAIQLLESEKRNY